MSREGVQLLHMRSFVVFLLATLVAVSASARPAGDPIRPARSAKPPVIDGVLDDEIWQTATQTPSFKTWRPDFGKEPDGQTIAYSAYDAENMYFAFRAFDREPSKIKASIAARDSIRPDDWICINLDSFDDQQALYGFYVNPLGIQMDSRYAANKEDLGFDAVWYSAGRIDDKGYTIEVRIPFKSIRYSTGKSVTMGVIFERSVSRLSEGSTYPALDPKAGYNFTIQTIPIVFSDIRHYTLLEVLPDVTYSQQHEFREGAFSRTASTGDVGATGRYGITPQLTVDGTYNPDFSQVEADAGQIDINLRHPLFFAEKRPFFLEGNEVFNIGGPAQYGVLASVLHTRTIVDPLAGVKVSGKVAASDTVAALYAIDRSGANADTPDGQVSVLRYKRAMNQDSYLGGFYVGREQGTAYNRVAGGDGAIRLSPSTAVGFHAFGSATSSPEGETSNGHAVGADLTRDTRRLSVYVAGLDVSKAFDVQSGYLLRTGVTEGLGTLTVKFYPGKRVLRRAQVGVMSSQTRDAFYDQWETYNELSGNLLLPRATSVTGRCFVASEIYLGEKFGTSGCTGSVTTQPWKEFRVQASASRGQAIYYSASPLGGNATRATLTFVYQPSDQWSETLSFTYANFDPAGGAPRLYDYGITRSRTTFQLNRYLFGRAIFEYNSYRRQLLTDLLASFTYIPGTVVHAGYGSLYERSQWDGTGLTRSSSFLELRRGLFFKASYLWRL